MAPLTRICLIGPESTGKSRIAERLAAELDAAFVAEYSREYALACGRPLTMADVDSIARGQIESEERVLREQPSRVVLDTDLISTVVYARHYYGTCPPWIEDAARERRADLYLLMDTDIEWIDDPVRDCDPDTREDLFDAFRRAMDEFETRWEIVSGTFDQRWARVVGLVATARDAQP